MEQVLGDLAEGFAQKLPVQGLDLGILVGEAQGGLTVQLVEPVAADAA